MFSPQNLVDRPKSMWRYREFLPAEEADIVTLGEGMTPLVPCPTLGQQIGLKHLYVKDETRNATWSFKDRMASVGVSASRRFGARVITGPLRETRVRGGRVQRPRRPGLRALYDQRFPHGG